MRLNDKDNSGALDACILMRNLLGSKGSYASIIFMRIAQF